MQPRDITSIKCPYCFSKRTKREGRRKNKLQAIQKYSCKDCNKNFTDKSSRGKTYTPKIILNAVSYYNLGHAQQEVSKLIAQKHKINVPQKTISNWINEYKEITTFNRLREQAKSLYATDSIIETYEFLHNNLNYKFKIHKAKLELILKNTKFNNNERFSSIKQFLEKITTKDFPHHIFKSEYHIENHNRASQISFNHLEIEQISKKNKANKLAELALNLTKTNKERHEKIQEFMLINDSTTIATEIPVYLTNDDLIYFISKGFSINPEEYKTPITGHIDILQIRNNLIHILDYKPQADKIEPIQQLTIYALALASRTKLDLKSFKCAWFDENNYFEFFPLHVVYKLRNKRKLPGNPTKIESFK